MSKFTKALVLALVASITLSSVAFAEGDGPESRDRLRRAVGTISAVDVTGSQFTLNTRSGQEVDIQVTEETKFRSRDGSIQGIEDLERGMLALVAGFRGEKGQWIATLVAAAHEEDLPERVRVAGEITSVEPAASAFSLKTKEGETVRFKVGERTRFRSRDGSIQGLEDLEPGMVALVIAVEGEEGGMLALMVAAGEPKERPQVQRFTGEITQVTPGRDTFSLKTREGAVLTFQVGERTRYRSRDGSIQGLQDLKAGMVALVAAVEGEDGQLVALLVAAGRPEDRPRFDVRAAGRIVALGDRSFTLQTRSGERMTFAVDENTIFKSRDGSVSGFGDLEVGMGAIVGARKQEDGSLKAVIVGAGRIRGERPDGRPDREPGSRPDKAPSRDEAPAIAPQG